MLFLNRLFGKGNEKKSNRGQSPRRRRLTLESLEQRELLSVTPYSESLFDETPVVQVAEAAGTEVRTILSGGTLTIEGTDGADWIEIEETASSIVVYSSSDEGYTYTVLETFSKSLVSVIEFYGYVGNDTFKNAHGDAVGSIDCRLYGGDGNDYLLGGSGNDLLDGGDGNNVLIGADGTNTFYNIGTGSNLFAWMSVSDTWATGNALDDNDARLLFTDIDPNGGTSTTDDIPYTAWSVADVEQTLSIMQDSYDVIGNYKFLGSPHYAGTTYVLKGDGGGASYNMASGYYIYTRYGTHAIIHEFAHSWQSDSVNPYWSQFMAVSWNEYTSQKDDAQPNDFSDDYATSSAGEDWAQTVQFVVYGYSTTGLSEKFLQKVEIVRNFFDWLNPEKETPSTVVTTQRDVVDANDGVISLREAVLYAGTSGLGTTITFASNMQDKTILLNGTELAVTKDITIDATDRNITIDADGRSGIMTVGTGLRAEDNYWYYGSSASVTLLGLTLTGAAGRDVITYCGDLTLIEVLVTGNDTTDSTITAYPLATDSAGITQVNSLTVIDTVFSENRNDGNLLSIRGTFHAERSQFVDNVSASTLFYVSGGALTFENSIVAGNESSSTGVFYLSQSEGVWTNTLLVGNSAAAAYFYNSTATFNNSTIAGNDGYVYQYGGGTLTLNNSILAYNNLSDGYDLYANDSNGTLITNSSFIRAIYNYGTYAPDTTSIVGTYGSPVDPLFVSFTAYTTWNKDLWKSWDLRLQTTSQAVNTGNNSLVPNGITTDLDGKQRIQENTVDMGAYETGTTVAPPSAVTGLTATSQTENTIALSWTTPAGATAITLQYKKSSGSTWTTTTATISNASFTVTGLDAGTSYDFRILASNGGGDSAWTTLENVATTSSVAPPSAVTGLTATSQTENTIALSWTTPAGATAITLQYKKSSGSTWTTTTATISNASFTVTGLDAETSYDFRILASNDGGDSAWTTLENVATLSTVPGTLGVPGTLRSTVSAKTVASLAWNAVEGAEEYEVQRLEGGEYVTIYRGTDRDCVDTDRTAGTTYTYRVRALNAQGASEYSASLDVTTVTASGTDTPVFTNVIQEGNQIRISWSDLGPDYIYVLFINGSPVLTNTQETSYVHTSLSNINTCVIYAHGNAKWTFSPTRVVSSSPVQAEILGCDIDAAGKISLTFRGDESITSYVVFRGGVPVGANLTTTTWTDESPLSGENRYVLYASYTSGERTYWVYSGTFIVNRSTLSSALMPLSVELDSFENDSSELFA